jgi:hypothetical protein
MRRWPPVRRDPGLARAFAHECKTPTCDVHRDGDVDPRRLDAGLWRAGKVGVGYSSGIDLVGPSYHVGFSRL